MVLGGPLLQCSSELEPFFSLILRVMDARDLLDLRSLNFLTLAIGILGPIRFANEFPRACPSNVAGYHRQIKTRWSRMQTCRASYARRCIWLECFVCGKIFHQSLLRLIYSILMQVSNVYSCSITAQPLHVGVIPAYAHSQHFLNVSWSELQMLINNLFSCCLLTASPRLQRHPPSRPCSCISM